MPETITVCRYCSGTLDLSWRRFADGRLHVQAKCLECLKFHGWVGQTPDVLAIVGPPPVADPVLFDKDPAP